MCTIESTVFMILAFLALILFWGHPDLYDAIVWKVRACK